MWLRVRPDALERVSGGPPPPGPRPGTTLFDPALAGAAAALVDAVGRVPGSVDRCAGARFADVLLARLADRLGDAGAAGRVRVDAVQAALEHIEARFEHALPLERVAAAAGLSPYHFARLFRRCVGTSVRQYVIGRRVARARELIERTDEGLADIAYAAGFGSQSHMTTVFGRHLGRTPGELRRELRGEPGGRPDGRGARF